MSHAVDERLVYLGAKTNGCNQPQVGDASAEFSCRARGDRATEGMSDEPDRTLGETFDGFGQLVHNRSEAGGHARGATVTRQIHGNNLDTPSSEHRRGG